jgi:hypothetical protein
MKKRTLVVLGCTLFFLAMQVPAQRVCAASPAADEIVRLEQRWITAILDGDKATVGAILSKDFKHFTSDGSVLDREQELATIKREPFTITLGEEAADFDSTGDAVVLHGLDTITQPGKPVKRQRWTDVFFKENGTWKAVSAQENVVP